MSIVWVEGLSSYAMANLIYCPGVRSLATLMFALILSSSSAVVASGEGCRFLCHSVSTKLHDASHL